MAGQRWEQEEIDALAWFVKKREQYKAGLAQSGEHVRQTDRKWTWSDIAKKMQQTAERDDWQVKRKYDGGALQMTWQTIQARKLYQQNVKSEAGDDDVDEDNAMTGIGLQIRPEHGTGETVDAFPAEPIISFATNPALAPTSVRDAPVTPSKPPNEVQIRFQHGIDHTVDVHFDPTANTITIGPKSSAPVVVDTPESRPSIKVEKSADQTFPGFSADTDRVHSFAIHSNPSTPGANPNNASHIVERQGMYSASPVSFDEHVTPTRLNTRWEDHELEALEWFAKKRKEEPSNGRMNGRNRIWTWDTIANKMNKVAARDGWDSGRVYTGGNCYGAWLTKSTRLPTSRPSNRRKPVHRTPGVPVQRTQFIPGDTVGSPVGTIQNTINPPPPGPDVALEPVPYHWLPAEREALHEVYKFSRISETKDLTRSECRKRGLWTWTMIAREMNHRAKESSWNTGRVYDQSNCYNMIKYQKDNFNLQGNVQPLEPDDEDEDDGEDGNKV
ncbi:hypothetical protein BKA64DRAFT_752284 [Cadophora sp. MPI-SDFR-AT-0126]|nr:hypothetical protein BKA64DRAFT_752284 [Leotiomycetes sp. MPI-SDFR-AT-0126]